MTHRPENRIWAVHAVVLAVGVLLSALVYYHGRGVMDVTEYLVERDLPTLKSLSDLKTDVVELEPILYEYYISGNRQRFLQRSEANEKRIEANLAVARAAFPQSPTLGSIEGRYAEIKSLARHLDETLRAAHIDRDKAKALITAISVSCARVIQELEGMVSTLHGRVLGRAQMSHSKVYGIVGVVVFFSGMLFLVVLVAGHYVKAYLLGVAELRRAEESLAYQAYHDALTGLPNRRQFQERLVEVLAGTRGAAPTAVMLVDVDRLKQVNDSLGHVVGDRLLQAVVERLQTLLRGWEKASAGSLYRLEGDLFAILMPAYAVGDAPVSLARHIAAGMEESLHVEGREFFVTFSIGIAVHPLDGEDPVTLVRNADSALYAVKQRGGNGFQCYAPEMNARALYRLELGNDLRRAVERNELGLRYQPQVDIASGRTVGAEALVRWSHADRGAISPGEFIPIAEESGLIVPISEWVLRAACSQAMAWLQRGLPALTMAVNISVRQFQSRDFPGMVESILKETGLAPDSLELEVTESLAMRDVEFTIATLRKLKGIGVRLAIDDFGTGYSSLSYLKQFPIDKLKVDQSFVRNLTVDPSDMAIVKAIIALAHSLQLRVIAEGVESEAQLRLLHGYGCHEVQGYLISQPLAPEDYAGFAAGYRRPILASYAVA